MPLFDTNNPKAIRAPKPSEKTAALILAAGNSTRMGGPVSKQLLPLCGIPVLAHTLMAYQACHRITEIIVAARSEDFDEIAKIRKEYNITKLHTVVSGGKNRQQSAERAFSKIGKDVSYVAIADGARCLTTPLQIAQVCLKAYRHKAASAAHAVADSMKRATPSGFITETVDREHLWAVQTPQIFHKALYHAAVFHAERTGFIATDDNALIEHLGYRIRLVECGNENLKITTQKDLALAEAILAYREKNK